MLSFANLLQFFIFLGVCLRSEPPAMLVAAKALSFHFFFLL
ncbi:hypothetical protein SSUR61_0914 [Streptococcus suis R61]|uniref:Uncharacterized protein n=1 Tax=Streptococcus suis R61 TaxID=996306 RepID=A0AA87F993_STRSU|nr:hypothetical protein SSUR61_0914 [Streptococcus suis R61]